MLWNDRRTPPGQLTDAATGKRKGARTPVSDADHAVLDAAWHKSFANLKAAGVEADADHPVAAAYRAASNAVNHANRSRDYGIATGQIKPTRTEAAHGFMKNAAESATASKTKPAKAKINKTRKLFKK